MTYGENYPTSGAYGAPTPVHPGDLLPRFFARVIDGIIVGVLAFFGAFSIGSMSDIMVTGLFSGLRNCQYLWIGLFQATSVPVDSVGAESADGVMSVGRSSSLPLWKIAPARTRATRCGALTARQRACAASISL